MSLERKDLDLFAVDVQFTGTVFIGLTAFGAY